MLERFKEDEKARRKWGVITGLCAQLCGVPGVQGAALAADLHWRYHLSPGYAEEIDQRWFPGQMARLVGTKPSAGSAAA